MRFKLKPFSPPKLRDATTRPVQFGPTRAQKFATIMRIHAQAARSRGDYEEASFATRVHRYVMSSFAPYTLQFTDAEWPTIGRALRTYDISFYHWLRKRGNYRVKKRAIREQPEYIDPLF